MLYSRLPRFSIANDAWPVLLVIHIGREKTRESCAALNRWNSSIQRNYNYIDLWLLLAAEVQNGFCTSKWGLHHFRLH
ncbi:uncharacterized protein J3R85_001693 [Psidium guajava]|nr:uncharacterized protein J3R85_001693 [Psidium guajava]